MGVHVRSGSCVALYVFLQTSQRRVNVGRVVVRGYYSFLSGVDVVSDAGSLSVERCHWDVVCGCRVSWWRTGYAVERGFVRFRAESCGEMCLSFSREGCCRWNVALVGRFLCLVDWILVMKISGR